jgi:hypothetical protein
VKSLTGIDIPALLGASLPASATGSGARDGGGTPPPAPASGRRTRGATAGAARTAGMDPGAAMAQASETIRGAAASVPPPSEPLPGSGTVHAAVAPPPTAISRSSTQPSATTSGAPSATAAELARSRAAMQSAADAVVAEGLRLAGAFLRGITSVERYSPLTIDQLAAQAPGRLKPSVNRLRMQLPDRVGAMTVGEILERTRGA